MSEPAILYVYVIGHDDGPQKIGFSNHPPTRARALKVTGQPQYKVHFAAEVAQADTLGIERLAHWILRDKALGRERFDVTVAEAIATVEDAVARYAAGERVPPRDDLMTERIGFMVPQSFIDTVDDWRVKQPRIPSWSQAVRVLVERALASEPPPRKPSPFPKDTKGEGA